MTRVEFVLPTWIVAVVILAAAAVVLARIAARERAARWDALTRPEPGMTRAEIDARIRMVCELHHAGHVMKYHGGDR